MQNVAQEMEYGPLFHFLCDILRPLPVIPPIIGWLYKLVLSVTVLLDHRTTLYGGAGREQVVHGAGGVEAQFVERGGEDLVPLVAQGTVEVVVVEDVVQDGAPLEHGGVAVYERGHLSVGVGRQELLGLVRSAFSFFLSTPQK